MLTKKFNRKAKAMDFFFDGTLVASADLDPQDIRRVEVELEAKYAKRLQVQA